MVTHVFTSFVCIWPMLPAFVLVFLKILLLVIQVEAALTVLSMMQPFIFEMKYACMPIRGHIVARVLGYALLQHI